MAKVKVTYVGETPLPKSGDYVEVVFEFSLVPSQFVGAPEEKSETWSARVRGKMSRSLQATWRLADSSVHRVLFEYSRRALLEKVTSGERITEVAVDLNTSTAPDQNPYDPEVIKIYVRHYQTDESIPQEFVDKIKRAGLFNHDSAKQSPISAIMPEYSDKV